LQRLGQVFELHPLVLEDVVNVPNVKVEDYEDQLVIIARMVLPGRGAVGFYSEQVGFVLGKHYLLTVQRSKSMIALNRCGRIRNNKGALRKEPII